MSSVSGGMRGEWVRGIRRDEGGVGEGCVRRDEGGVGEGCVRNGEHLP